MILLYILVLTDLIGLPFQLICNLEKQAEFMKQIGVSEKGITSLVCWSMAFSLPIYWFVGQHYPIAWLVFLISRVVGLRNWYFVKEML